MQNGPRHSREKHETILSSRQVDPPAYLVFWDMDDTCIVNNRDDPFRDNSIKNAHILLPIMLFETMSPNQHIAICTNRSSKDNEGCYPVANFIKDLLGFGIKLPSEHVRYGGGANNIEPSEDYATLQSSLQGLAKQVENIQHTQVGENLKSALELFKTLTLEDKKGPAQTDAKKDGLAFLGAQIERASFYGKNYHINKFLNDCFSAQRGGFLIEDSFWRRDELICGIVDDKGTIAGEDVLSPLGRDRYFGIKASDGGREPKDISLKGDYYQDQYLFDLGKKIGLDHFALYAMKTKSKQEHPMLHVAGLLYAWQAYPKDCKIDTVINGLERLNSKQCDQIVAMLSYIAKYANEHSDAHYNSVDKILIVAQNIAATKFLDEACETIYLVRENIEVERLRAGFGQLTTSTSAPDLTDVEDSSRKKKNGSSIFKFSFRKSSSKREPIEEHSSSLSRPEATHLEILMREEQVLCSRVQTLKGSPLKSISSQAKAVDKLLRKQSHSGAETITKAKSRNYRPLRISDDHILDAASSTENSPREKKTEASGDDSTSFNQGVKLKRRVKKDAISPSIVIGKKKPPSSEGKKKITRK